MSITAGIIIYTLSLDTTIHTNIGTETDFSVEAYELWEGGFPENNVLYVLSRETLLSDLSVWRNKFVLCTGWLQVEELGGQELWWISMTGKLRPQEVMKHLQRVFRRYYQWQHAVETLVRKRKSFSELLDTLEDSYQLIGCIATQDMLVAGSSSGFEESNHWTESRKIVTLSQVNELVMDQDFQEAAEQNEVFLYYNTKQEWYYCYNFKVDGEYQARLVVNVRSHQKAPGVRQLIQEFGECVADVYEDYYRDGQSIQSGKEFYELTRELIRGQQVNMGDIRRILDRYRWDIDQEYQVLLIRFQEGVSAGVGMSYYKTQITKLFSDCRVITDRERFICIRNLSCSRESEADYEQALPYFLRETLCKAGISGRFRGFEKLYRYYLEAERALWIGERSDSTRWYYFFPHYVIPYLMEQCTRELYAEQICHPALRILDEYDASNGTFLTETMETFLTERYSIARTAERLDIHRTTLLARLERIRILTGVEFKNYSENLHLMLSFEIRKYEGPAGRKEPKRHTIK